MGKLAQPLGEVVGAPHRLGRAQPALRVVEDHHDVARLACGELGAVHLFTTSGLSARREDTGVAAGEAQPQEGRADEDQPHHHRHEHAPGMRHHQGGEPPPGAVTERGLVGVQVRDTERVHAGPEHGE